MILDFYSNIESYKDLSKDIFAGLVFLEKAKCNISLGVNTNNDRVNAIVEEYQTTQHHNIDFESHKYAIDIQYPIIGLELILWFPIKDMKIKTPYHRKKDYRYFTNPHHQATQVDIGNRSFSIFFENDGHSPEHCVDSSEFINKLLLRFQLVLLKSV